MNNSKIKSTVLIWMAIMGLMMTGTALAQPTLTLPEISQAAQIEQTIGLTRIEISFHRPAVRGRKIWGGLVPYNEVWRAGANENTTISFSDPVMIDGHNLPEGKYGLHIIPTPDEWTIIFNTVNTGWGSYSYNESKDALRITTMPETVPFEEFLSYRFDNPSQDSVEVALYWEKLRAPFTVSVNKEIVLKHLQNELYGAAQFNWQNWLQAAQYAYSHKLNPQLAMKWVDRSISMNKNLRNLYVKANLLRNQGNAGEANHLMEEALTDASEVDLNWYGYQLMNQKKMDEAITVFKRNVKEHPKSWNVYDSLGEAYAKKGNTGKALEFYNKAYSMTDNEQQRTRIESILSKLKAD